LFLITLIGKKILDKRYNFIFIEYVMTLLYDDVKIVLFFHKM